ncbi:MAG: SRPBCC family protein [Acidimicrobiales bacterium]|jgi:hypothetical protein
MTIERLEVARRIAADPEAIFAILRSPQGHVAIDSSGMLLAAEGAEIAQVGDTFIVHMDREALNDYPMGKYDVKVTITTFEENREIAWNVAGVFRGTIGHIYGYTLEPVDNGTIVTSYYDWSGADQKWKDAAIFPVLPESTLRATLGILARAVQRTDTASN